MSYVKEFFERVELRRKRTNYVSWELLEHAALLEAIEKLTKLLEERLIWELRD